MTPPIRPELKATSYAASDVGRRRKVNEDSFLCDDALGLWIVADGMGGHAAGDVASREAVETVQGMVKQGRAQLDASDPLSERDVRAACRLVEGAIQAATYMVFALAELDADKAGMGTTISAMLRFNNYAVLGQVGDSRVYRVRDDKAEQLTEDHTLINWQIKQGLITEEEARVSRQRNVITRAVGNKDYVQVDTAVVALELGDIYLLCSDGLHGYLQLSEIPQLVKPGGQTAVEQLVDVANERGGKDNITAVQVEII